MLKFPDRRYLILFLIVFVNFLGSTIVLPTLPLYTQRNFSASPEKVSLLLASFFAAQFLAAPVLGRLSDKYGRRPILIISQIGTVLSFLLMAIAPNLSILFLARILDGVTGGNVIVAQAYMTDITPREQRTQGLGLIFAAFGLGYILGPALGGLIAAFTSDHAPFVVGAVVTAMTVLLTFFALEESLPKSKRQQRVTEGRSRMRLSEVTGNRSLQIILLIGFCAQFSIAVLQAVIVLFAASELFQGMTDQSINLGVGLLLTCIGLGQFFTQLVLIRPAVKRYGERRLVVIGDLMRAAGMLTMVVFVSPWLVGGVSLMLVAVASGLMMPSLQALATTSVREEITGGVLGVYNSATSLGLITGTALGGVLFAMGPRVPFAIAGGVLLLTVIPALMLLRRDRPAPSTVAATGSA